MFVVRLTYVTRRQWKVLVVSKIHTWVQWKVFVVREIYICCKDRGNIKCLLYTSFTSKSFTAVTKRVGKEGI